MTLIKSQNAIGSSIPAVDNLAKFDSEGNIVDSGVPYTQAQILDGEVNTYADLPAAASHNGEVWLVKTTTGIQWINQKLAGFWVSNGSAWSLVTPLAGTLTESDLDTDGTLAANSDQKIATQKAVKTYADTKVNNTGDETISGIKTFNDSPLVPKATTGDNTTKAASTSFVTTADNNVKLYVNDNYQNLEGLDTSSGYVGLTGYSINFKDTTGARKSLLTNSNTVARTYTFQDKDGTIADLADVALKAPLASPTFTGTVTVPTPSNATDATTKGYVDNASSNASVIAKVLTGFSAAAGTVAATDSILQAFNKVVGNLNALSSPLAGFQISYTNSTQQLSDSTDISWTGRTDYAGLGSQISFSGTSITFASGYKYIVLCSMSAVLYTDPAYKLTWSMRTGGANVGADGILWSNPNGSTNDLGIGGTILGGIYIDTSGGSATYQLRKVSSGGGSSSPTCQGQIIVIAFT